MPTREYKRLWCKTCNNWELFEQYYPNWKEWFCKECENVYKEIPLTEIPEEKIMEQRKRYTEYNNKFFEGFLHEMILTPEQRNVKELINMFSPPGSDYETKIIESDAGQYEVDQIEKKKRKEERTKLIEEKEKVKKYLLKYKGLNRNDICPCGSGKKYKKCCLPNVLISLVKYNLRF